MLNKILIVDDAKFKRDMLSFILQDTYEIVEADGGKKAVEILNEKWNEIDAVLLDIHMPEVNGFDVLAYMKQKDWIGKIPVLIISSEHAVQVENRCFEEGVSDFIHEPFDGSLIKNRVKNILELFAYQNELEQKVEFQTKTLKNQYHMLQLQATKLRENNDRIMEILGTVVEHRTLESGRHIRNVKKLAQILAEEVMRRYPEYRLSDAKIREIVVASSLHDLGKISIPDKILLKPGKLTADEYEFMKSHTTRGCEMLKAIEGIWEDEYRKTCYEICRYHHERYDGNGYPDGLKGEEIPISAQIVSVADVYDALVSERIYKNAYSLEEAFYMVINGECGVFSPKIMECFRCVREQFEEAERE